MNGHLRLHEERPWIILKFFTINILKLVISLCTSSYKIRIFLMELYDFYFHSKVFLIMRIVNVSRIYIF
jgi:hypothetical protein